ncbi:MAG: protein jag [Clostridia bacterium]|nr:protein jag [Clostridia bacterium]
MIRENIALGADVAEAKENALAGLGDSIPENVDVQFEIIELPKKKVLGLFGGCKAKVKAFYELPDDKPLKRVEKYERSDKKSNEKAKPQKQKNAPKPQKAEKPAEKPKQAETAPEKPELVAVEDPAKKATVDTGVAFVTSVLEKMEIEAKVTGGQLGSSLAIVLEGEHLGAIVGRRGETLDALQYLTTLVANRGEGEYQRITLNIGDYREKREKTLRSLARRMANQAVKTGRNMTLEPMNPYERRIIHTAVQDVKGVTSWSVGEEPNRKVVIGTEKGKGGRGGNRNNRNSAPKAEPNREQKKDMDSAPLYGRIG